MSTNLFVLAKSVVSESIKVQQRERSDQAEVVVNGFVESGHDYADIKLMYLSKAQLWNKNCILSQNWSSKNE